MEDIGLALHCAVFCVRGGLRRSFFRKFRACGQFRKRKHSKKSAGHRQYYVELKIETIAA